MHVEKRKFKWTVLPEPSISRSESISQNLGMESPQKTIKPVAFPEIAPFRGMPQTILILSQEQVKLSFCHQSGLNIK